MTFIFPDICTIYTPPFIMEWHQNRL